jgi:hypothetical protein
LRKGVEGKGSAFSLALRRPFPSSCAVADPDRAFVANAALRAPFEAAHVASCCVSLLSGIAQQQPVRWNQYALPPPPPLHTHMTAQPPTDRVLHAFANTSSVHKSLCLSPHACTHTESARGAWMHRDTATLLFLSRRLCVASGSRAVAVGLDATGEWSRSDLEGELLVYRTEAHGSSTRRAAAVAAAGTAGAGAGTDGPLPALLGAGTSWHWASVVWRVGTPPLPLQRDDSADPAISVIPDYTGAPERYALRHIHTQRVGATAMA